MEDKEKLLNHSNIINPGPDTLTPFSLRNSVAQFPLCVACYVKG